MAEEKSGNVLNKENRLNADVVNRIDKFEINISQKLDDLKTTINQGKGEQWQWLKDYAVPIAGVILTVVGLWFSHLADKRLEKDAELTRKQKYLEFFLANYSDSTNGRQNMAFALLNYVDGDVKRSLIRGLSGNLKLNPETFRTLLKMDSGYIDFSEADEDTVLIAFNETRRKDALKIMQQLWDAGFKGKFDTLNVHDTINALNTLKFANKGYWEKYGTDDYRDDFRYDISSEVIASAYLFRFINEKNPDLHLHLLGTNDTTRQHHVSVFLPPKYHS